MIAMGVLMDIHSLARQGYSCRQIAKLTGIHRQTIKKYLQEGVLPTYKAIKRTSRSILIKSWYKAGWSNRITKQPVFMSYCRPRFNGCVRTVRRYVAELKEKRDAVAYVRFETMPGQQAQVDFGDFVISCSDGSKLTIYCFIMVLGYSRKMYIEFIDRCTLANFLKCHQKAFEYFGVSPARSFMTTWRTWL